MTEHEMQMEAVQLRKALAEIDKLIADTKVSHQTARKMFMETILYPFVAGAAVCGAIVGVMKYFS